MCITSFDCQMASDYIEGNQKSTNTDRILNGKSNIHC